MSMQSGTEWCYGMFGGAVCFCTWVYCSVWCFFYNLVLGNFVFWKVYWSAFFVGFTKGPARGHFCRRGLDTHDGQLGGYCTRSIACFFAASHVFFFSHGAMRVIRVRCFRLYDGMDTWAELSTINKLPGTAFKTFSMIGPAECFARRWPGLCQNGFVKSTRALV